MIAVPLHAAVAATSLRGSDQDGYSRFVIDFGDGTVPQHSLSADGAGQLRLTVQSAIDAAAPALNLAAIDDVKMLKDGARTVITLTRPANAKFRSLVIGNRLLVDVYTDGATEKPEASTPAAPAQATDNSSSVPQTPPTSPPAASPPTTSPPPTSPPAVPEAAPKPAAADMAALAKMQEIGNEQLLVDANKTTAPDTAATTPEFGMQIAGTQAFGVAIFQRNDVLWVVLDQPDVAVPPQFLGAAGKVFGQPERVEAKEASVFRYPVIDPAAIKGLNPVGEGKDLVWQIHWRKATADVPPLLHDAIPAHDGADGRLEWQSRDAHRAVTFTDPLYGDNIVAITVTQADEYGGPVFVSYPQVDVLPSSIGLGMVARVDNLEVKITKGDPVTITRPGGLAISDPSEVPGAQVQAIPADAAQAQQATTQASERPQAGKRFYQLQRWSMGDTAKLRTNHLALIGLAGKMEGASQAEQLLKLAKLHLAHGQGQETLGLLDLAQESFPALAQTPDFLALRGAGGVAGRQYDVAFRNLFSPSLDAVEDIGLWRAAALAGLEDWAQAAKQLPVNAGLLEGYTSPMKERLALSVAEVALRDGQIDQAKALLGQVEPIKDSLTAQQATTYTYLQGELARQTGDTAKATELWESLRKSPDDYYRARSGLALVALGEQKKDLKTEDAIDRLEGLRYAWRGDELEIDIASRLGDLYVARNEYLRGLAILRSAAKVTDSPKAQERIKARMHEIFAGLLTPQGLAKLSPVQALTLYREFGDLLPPGAEGQAMVRALSEKLAENGMLESAQGLLQQQGKTPATPLDGAAVNLRLAALALRDRNAESALGYIDVADKQLATVKVADAAAKQRESALLRARAYSQQNKAEAALSALSLLQPDDDVLSLRADIAWKAGDWNEASTALGDIVQNAKISTTRPPTPEQAQLVLNWAVALNLANNRYVLANVRERYGDLMKQSTKSKDFEVVTRPRQNVALADRQTLEGMVKEVDLFKDFLGSYAQQTAPAPAPAAAAKPGAAGGASTQPGGAPEAGKEVGSVPAATAPLNPDGLTTGAPVPGE